MILMLMRHGKAEKDSATGEDADRELVGLGRRQAEHIAKQFLGKKPRLPKPAIILCSPAVRARDTAAIVADAIGMRTKFVDELTLNTSATKALAVIRKLAARDEPALIVGHNPQMEELVTLLCDAEVEVRTGELVYMNIRADGADLVGSDLECMRLEEN